jgi:hypothetical protein
MEAWAKESSSGQPCLILLPLQRTIPVPDAQELGFAIVLKRWWVTLESNQAWVSPAELQSAAAPCSSSPDGVPNTQGSWGRQGPIV